MDFANGRKEESKPPEPPKRKKKKQRNWVKLWELIIHRCIGQSCLNLVCGVLTVEGVCTMKKTLVQQGSTELRMLENCVLVLPADILTVWHAGFTWPHDTLLCVLIYCVTSISTIVSAGTLKGIDSLNLNNYVFIAWRRRRTDLRNDGEGRACIPVDLTKT